MRAKSYAPPVSRGRIELHLSRNEGRPPRALAQAPVAPEDVARYPDLAALRAELARRWELPSARVLLTAGADDALLRTCLAVAGTAREALLTSPTFEMIPRYVRMAGLRCRELEWKQGPFPTEAFIRAARDAAIAFIVSPNNPTGAIATHAELARIAEALPETLVVLDAAYGELANADPSAASLDCENVVVVRTLSKAWGLAGLRVGYALGSEAWIERLGAVGNPFPVSAPSAAIAMERLASGAAEVREYVERVSVERRQLDRTLARLGAQPARPTEANFVLARGLDPSWTAQAAASLGVALRAFPDRPELADALRITVPGEARAFARLEHTLAAVLDPQALLFDLDVLLAEEARASLAVWSRELRLAVVSDLSRAEVQESLERRDLLPLMDLLVCREDASLTPAQLALAKLGVERAWMLGATSISLASARAAGVVPIGVLSTGSPAMTQRAALEAAGAARVLSRLCDLKELLR